MAEYYLGYVKSPYINEDKDITKDYHVVTVNIPSFGDNLIAFPKFGVIDEPKTGDPVLCLDLDSEYHSYLIYEPIKETDFIGFRADGKILKINDDSLLLGAYEIEKNKRDEQNTDSDPEATVCSMEFLSDGNIIINAKQSAGSTTGVVTINNGNNGGAVNIKCNTKGFNSIGFWNSATFYHEYCST